MKKLIKMLIATTLLLSTLTALCIPALAVTFSDVGKTHWAYESVDKISEKGLMIGRGTPGGVVFGPNGYILGVEIYETLYRVASEKNVADYFDGNIYFYDTQLNMWYTDSYEWAMRNGVGYVEYTKASGFPDISSYIASGRHGSECLSIPPEEQYVDSVEGFEKKYFSRTDVILSLYYYVTTYMGINITDNTDLSHFSDWSYEELEKNTYPNKGLNSNYILYSCSDTVYTEEMISAWEWAVATGIIKGCDNNTLQIGEYNSETGSRRYITRAEYAVILDRFTDYLETIK